MEPTQADNADGHVVQQYRAGLTPLSSAAGNTVWPQLFGPQRTCVAPDQPVDLSWGADGPDELWSMEVGTGYGSPVVADGKVIFNHRVGEEEIIACVSADEGVWLWEHRYPTSFVYDGDYSDGPYSTPLVAEGRVYSVGAQGQLFCLQLATGDVIWNRELHQEYEIQERDSVLDKFAVGATPLFSDGRLIFNLGGVDAGIIALDAASGDELWKANDDPAGFCSPFAAKIHDQDFVFVYTDRNLVSLDPASGELDWQVEHYGRAPMSHNAVSPLVVDDKVLIVTGPGPGALCVQVHADRSFTQLWKDRRVLDSQYNTLMHFDDSVIGFTASGQGGAELRCVELATGQLRWRYHSLLRRGQGLVVADALVVLGEQGHLAALLPSQNEVTVLAFTEQPLMSQPCYCAPALAGSKLYLKDEQRIACFDLSRRNQPVNLAGRIAPPQ